MSTLPPALKADVLAAIQKAPSPTQDDRGRTALAGVAMGTLTAIVMLSVLGVSLGGRPLPFVALSGVGWAVIAAVGTRLGGRGRSMVGRAQALLVVLALALAPAIFGWVLACTELWPEVRTPEGTLRQHLTCLFLTSLLSLGPVIALAVVRRGLDPVHPRATGAAAFAAAAAWGGVLIDMHCPLVSPAHVALGHVMPVVVYAAVGALLGARLFGLSTKR
jgi:hypothetical protein